MCLNAFVDGASPTTSDSAGGAYSAPLNPLDDLGMGRGRIGKEKGRRNERGRWKGREEKGKEGKVTLPRSKNSGLRPCPMTMLGDVTDC